MYATRSRSSELEFDSFHSAVPAITAVATVTATTANTAHTVLAAPTVRLRGGFMRKRIIGVALSALTLVLAPLATDASASTRSDVVSLAKSACGSGYTTTVVADYQGIPKQYYWYVLLYNSSNGYNCALQIKDSANTDYGKASKLGVGIKVSGGSWHEDDGNYTKYAGPVYVHAPNTCVYLTPSPPRTSGGATRWPAADVP
jgi:hypothetical protein